LGMLLIFGIIRLTLAQYFAKKVEDHKYGKMFLNLVIWLLKLHKERL